MKCPKCNFEVLESQKFCPECGEKLSEQKSPNESSTNNCFEGKKPIKKKWKLIAIITISLLSICLIVLIFLHFFFTSCVFNKHNYSDLIQGAAPTCTSEGYEYQYCLDCGKTLNTITLKKIDHTFTEGECGQERTCTSCGERKTFQHEEAWLSNTCKHCNKPQYSVILPSTPATVHVYDNSNNIEESIVITEISSESSDIGPVINYTVERKYHEEGSNYSDDAKFGWKLYAPNGAVVASGTAKSKGNIKVGEKSVGSFTIYYSTYDLEKWTDYKLEILNLS